MTDEGEDPAGLQGSEPSTEPPLEESLHSWAQSNSESTWTSIEVEGDSGGAVGGRDPIPAPTSTAPAAAPTSTAPAAAPTSTAPAAAAPHRSRRPSSLRSTPDDALPSVPRRPLTPPPPSAPAAASPRPTPVAAPASSAPVASEDPGPPVLSLAKRLTDLAQERPEVVLGAAFFGGLLLATILKRLGRK